jgi:hypothetical protein
MPHCLYVHKPRYDEEDITNIANLAALRESHGLVGSSEQISIPSGSNLQIDDPSTSNSGDNERTGGDFTAGERERVMSLESRIGRRNPRLYISRLTMSLLPRTSRRDS